MDLIATSSIDSFGISGTGVLDTTTIADTKILSLWGNLTFGDHLTRIIHSVRKSLHSPPYNSQI